MAINTILNKVLEYNKERFNTVFEAIAEAQDNTEKITRETIETIGIIPDEGKTFVTRLYEVRRRVRDDYRDAVTKVHDQIETIIAAVPLKHPEIELKEH